MFDPQVAFSKCELQISTQISGLKRFIRLSALVDVEKCVKLYSEAGDEIKKALSTSLKYDNQSEVVCAVELAGLVAPLCREVLLENRYGGESFPLPIRTSSLGLGSPLTWHGSPDLRLRGTSPGPEF